MTPTLRTAPDFVPLSLAAFRVRVRDFAWTRRVTAIHMHHTWKPERKDYAGESTIRAMWNYHVNDQGWADIAQHVTVAPDGIIWTGRDWNMAPASNAGDNGDAAAGPFMFEMVGNFDRGHDVLDGPQLESVYGVIVAVEDHFGLATNALKFHRDLGSPKTCPGNGIDYADFLERVRAYRLGRRVIA